MTPTESMKRLLEIADELDAISDEVRGLNAEVTSLVASLKPQCETAFSRSPESTEQALLGLVVKGRWDKTRRADSMDGCALRSLVKQVEMYSGE